MIKKAARIIRILNDISGCWALENKYNVTCQLIILININLIFSYNIGNEYILSQINII